MKIGFIGLGKMGGGMAERLVRGGHEVLVYDRDRKAVAAAAQKGTHPMESMQALISGLEPPRLVWVMLQAGTTTESVIGELAAIMKAGDIIIDGGNSNYNDSIKRADELRKKGIHMLDVGTSGGVRGLHSGYCIMVGGDGNIFKTAEPVFRALAVEKGYARVGKNGAGHFVKMIHNGVEYALLQAYGEGFEIMESKKEFGLDLLQISQLWNRGSVVRSWLLELCESAFEKDPGLSSIKGHVEDSGEGRWSVFEAINQDIPAPAITLALLQRFASRQDDSFSARVIAALRNEFGGHAVKPRE